MKRISLAVLIFLVILAGCSSPTTESKKEEPQSPRPLTSENTATKTEVQQRVDKEQQQVYRSVPAAEAMASPPQAARMKAAITAGMVAADRALYSAKAIGRDRWSMAVDSERVADR